MPPKSDLSAERASAERERATSEIEGFLQDAIQRLEPDLAERRRNGPGRPRIVPSLCLWAGMLVCVLRGFTSQHALWRLLSDASLWFYPRFAVTDQAIYKRLAQGGSAVLEQLFRQISELLRQRLEPYALNDLGPFAKEVVALDESTLDPIARKLPALRGLAADDPRRLPGKLAGTYDLRRQQWRCVQHIVDPQQNEKVAARGLIAELPPGSLILADLGYFGFAWFDELTTAGHWWVSRLRAKTSYSVRHIYYQEAETLDALIWLGAYRADQAAHTVRLVCFRLGATSYHYLSNVLDPRQLSIRDIARLYARRWDFELAVKLIKRHLDLHLLWSSKTVVIVQQLWAVLIIAQILQALQMEIAGRAGVDPFDVSLALLVQYLPQHAYRGRDPLQAFIENGRAMGYIRPSRRTKIRAPEIPPEQLEPLPPDFELVRAPRYARRRCVRPKVAN